MFLCREEEHRSYTLLIRVCYSVNSTVSCVTSTHSIGEVYCFITSTILHGSVSVLSPLLLSTKPLFVWRVCLIVAFIFSDYSCDWLTCLSPLACLAGRVRVLPPVAPPPDDGYPFPTPDGKLPEQRRAEGTANWLHTYTHLETHKNITD